MIERVFGDGGGGAEEGGEDGGNLQKRSQENRPKASEELHSCVGLDLLLQNKCVVPAHTPEGLPGSHPCFYELILPLSQGQRRDSAEGAGLNHSHRG